MATPNFAKKNPFMGMTVAQMKSYYDKKVRGKKLSAKELKNMADQMQAAKKAAPKAKPAASKPRQTTRKEAEARFFSSSSQGAIAQNQEKARRNFFRSSSGTRGQFRLKGTQVHAVLRRGFATGPVHPLILVNVSSVRTRQEAARQRLRGNTNRRGRAF